LGIDPSLTATGFGVIEDLPEGYRVVAHGVIKPSPRRPMPQRLLKIRDGIEDLIRTHLPDEVAIENPFLARNTKTALILGQVRGAVLVAAAGAGRDVHEYSALEIKKAVTGYGQADKTQVQHMVKVLLGIEDQKLSADASDALATAVCHVNTRRFQDFIQDGKEPERP